MKNHCTTILFLLYFSLGISAQEQNLVPADSIYYYLKQAKACRLNNIFISENHARKALALSYENGTDTLIMDSEQSLGICFIVQYRFREADSLFRKVAQAARKRGDLYRESRSLANRSITLSYEGKHEELISLQDTILEKLAHTDFNLLKSAAYTHKALGYTNQLEYEKAITAHQNALKYIDLMTPNDPSIGIVSGEKEKHIADIKMSLANTWLLWEKPDSALKILDELNVMSGNSPTLEQLCAKTKCLIASKKYEAANEVLNTIVLGGHDYSLPTNQFYLSNRIMEVYKEKNLRTREVAQERDVYQLSTVVFVVLIVLISILLGFLLKQKQELKDKHRIISRQLEEEVRKRKEQEDKKVRVKSGFLQKIEEEVSSKFFLDADKANQKALARRIGINRNELSNLVNTEFKMKYSEWLASMRVEEAKRLMLEDPSIAQVEIILHLGISESSYYRIFKKHTDFTPQEYVQKLKE